MKSIQKNVFLTSCITLCMLIFAACEKVPEQPKPPTYLRLDVKKSEYIRFENKDLPFVFEYPKDCRIERLESKNKNTYWFNLNVEKYNFEINVSYFNLTSKSDLKDAVNDCFTFINRHEKLSAGILQQDYKNQERRVFGTAFELKGRDVVSPYQFYLTDSTRHFIRFALNNKIAPNNDSVSSVVKRLKEDMQHIINTFEWK